MKLLTFAKAGLAIGLVGIATVLALPSVAEATQSQADIEATLTVTGGCSIAGNSTLDFGTSGPGGTLGIATAQVISVCTAGLAPTFALSDFSSTPSDPNRFTLVSATPGNLDHFAFDLVAQDQISHKFFPVANDPAQKYTFGIVKGSGPTNQAVIHFEGNIRTGSFGRPDIYRDIIVITVTF